MDWVQSKECLDCNGNTTNSVYLAPIQQSKHSGKQPIPDARNRADKEQKKYSITLYFVFEWLGILIIMGGIFGDMWNQNTVWKKVPFGFYLPYIQNTMSRDVFRWMRCYIHFTDNSKCKNKPKDESIQATTWRDKKQVLFLYTAKVGRSNSIDTKCHVKRKQEQITIQSMQAQQNLFKIMKSQ